MAKQPEVWIIAAKWANSSDTYHGPWAWADDAERWAKLHLDREETCKAWSLGILTPEQTSAVSRRLDA